MFKTFIFCLLACILTSACAPFELDDISPMILLRDAHKYGNFTKIIGYLENGDPIVRTEAVKLLGESGRCRDFSYRVNYETSTIVLKEMAKQFGNCNDKVSLSSLEKLLKNKDASVRMNAATAAVENDFCREDCYFLISGLLSDSDSLVRLSAAKALYKTYPDQARQVATDLLSENLDFVQIEAIKLLGLTKQKSDIYLIAGFLNDDNKKVSIAAKYAIEMILGTQLSMSDYATLTEGKLLTGTTNDESSGETIKPKGKSSNKSLYEIDPRDYSLKKFTGNKENKVAVIIGNKDYESNNIPDVDYAIRDAKLVRQLFINLIGIKEENIIYIENAKKSDFDKIFGTQDNFKGKLYSWALQDTDLYVYYSGHGAPDPNTGKPFFVPTDGDLNFLELSGYPVNLVYSNLSKIPSKNKFVFVESCFSGATHSGTLMKSASPVFVEVDESSFIPSKGIVSLSSSRGDQISSWDERNRHGLFTYSLYKALTTDTLDSDGVIDLGEIEKFIEEDVTVRARREFNRIQNPIFAGSRSTPIVRQ